MVEHRMAGRGGTCDCISTRAVLCWGTGSGVDEEESGRQSTEGQEGGEFATG